MLAHGVFDLVHLGHVRHLESAAREGDVLVVSVTADRFVNKGPGRPVFSARLRGEMLAALECVGAVGISEAPGADEMIRAVRPDVYVKGPDYKDQDGDITGKINAERAAVEQFGGRIAFTDDMVLSSSQLINDHFSLLDPEVQSYLNGLRVGGALPQVMKAIESIADMKVLFVGDAIIDEYQYAHAMGKSAKENIIASRSVGSEIFAGGIVAAANHAADFCAEVEIITGLGRQDSHEQLIRDSLRDNVKANFVYRGGMPTTRKCRFIDPAHLRKLFEIYYFDDRPLGGPLEQQFCDLIREKAPDFDVVVVADFGHGLITRKSIDALTEASNFMAVNAQSNSANLGYNMITKYATADYVCIDAPEARMASGDRFGELGDIVQHRLSRSVNSERFVITDGERRCVTFSGARGWSRVPAFTQHVVDTVGAGDAFFFHHGTDRRQGHRHGFGRPDRQCRGRHEGRHRRPSQVGGENTADEIHHRSASLKTFRNKGFSMNHQVVNDYFETLGRMPQSAKVTDWSGSEVAFSDFFQSLIEWTKSTHKSGNSVLFVGNGGSAAVASHMAIDFSKNGGIRARAFNDASALTCLANDFSYDAVFSEQIKMHARQGDLLIAISSSGGSKNILNAAAAARAAGCRVVTLSGFKAGNPLRKTGDLNAYVPSAEYGFVEIAHLALIHAVVDLAAGWPAWESAAQKPAADVIEPLQVVHSVGA